jgi:predicted metalloprotease with PDZ domain
MKSIRLLIAAFMLTAPAGAQQISERLHVDASDAPRNILHSTVTIPITGTSVTLVYPKWIPGNHRPTGPIQNVTGLHIKANGQELEWTRDLVDMWAFHLQAPAGTHELEVSFDTITYNGTRSAASSNLLDLNWNQVVMYPANAPSDAVQVAASIHLPTTWRMATALQRSPHSGCPCDQSFQPVSLTRLVDSPLIAGAHFREIQLGDALGAPHFLDIVAESEDALQISDAMLTRYQQLVQETTRLFGARHYDRYTFLLTLSDNTAHHGLEHHESSDNGSAEELFSDASWQDLEADLLPHEFTHSWNGKYRRPAGLATSNYQDPMHGDLLWVYEGMTDYWGNILAARSGLRTAQQFQENLAYTAAMLDHRAGRTWRPLQDTATSVQILFGAAGEWTNWRRSADYYPEAYLVWLEVDTLIRKQSNGQKSLDDFCRAFFGPPNTPPKVMPYAFEDIVAALNQTAPYDWARLLRDRLDSKSAHAPLGGIENGGWKLVYNDQKNSTMAAGEKTGGGFDLSFSLGMILNKEGIISDVIPGSPAYAAGIGPGMKLIAVNGRKYTKDVLRAALRAAAGGSIGAQLGSSQPQTKKEPPIALLAENAEFIQTYNVDYHGGEKYPHLERNPGQRDILSDIVKPLTQ